MRFRFIYILLFISSTTLFAQSAADGEALFNNKQFAKAKAVYQSLLTSKPYDPLFNYRYARCLYELKDYSNAIKHFELSGSRFPLTPWYLAELYFLSYRFDESAKAYQNYITSLSPDDKKIAELELQKKKSELGAKLIRRIENITIIDSISVEKNSFLKKYNFNPELGSLKHSQLKLNSKKNIDIINYTTQRGDRTIYSDTVKGQTDILSSFKQLEDWSEPVSISKAVNTESNENYPFLLLDGLTLYFATDGENSLGGYDIFITKYSSNIKGFLTPENIGFPFNSPANDYMMVIDEQRNLGWFATDRNQPAGKVTIYKFVPNKEKIIYRTENLDTLVRAAELKLYRKVLRTNIENVAIIQHQHTQKYQQLNFIVNDSLIYTHFEEFRSNKALTLWNEYTKLKNSVENLTTSLNTLRTKYEAYEYEEDRKKITLEILQKEVLIFDLQKELDLKLISSRNEEIIFLNKSYDY
ncbi:MAG: tetratricopeptide repeat protein [Paludibacter sp.]|nr:tetratricopeptide repeat protein [Paludibacter sp.]